MLVAREVLEGAVAPRDEVLREEVLTEEERLLALLEDEERLEPLVEPTPMVGTLYSESLCSVIAPGMEMLRSGVHGPGARPRGAL